MRLIISHRQIALATIFSGKNDIFQYQLSVCGSCTCAINTQPTYFTYVCSFILAHFKRINLKNCRSCHQEKVRCPGNNVSARLFTKDLKKWNMFQCGPYDATFSLNWQYLMLKCDSQNWYNGYSFENVYATPRLWLLWKKPSVNKHVRIYKSKKIHLGVEAHLALQPLQRGNLWLSAISF